MAATQSSTDDASKYSSSDGLTNAPPVVSSSTMSGSKSKKNAKSAKATPDPNETGKLLAAMINQLELNDAADKDEKQEIGMFRHHTTTA